MSFFVISGKIVFLLSRKYDIFSLEGKLKNIFLKNTWKYDMFYIYICMIETRRLKNICINVRNMILPFSRKNEHTILPKKCT